MKPIRITLLCLGCWLALAVILNRANCASVASEIGRSPRAGAVIILAAAIALWGLFRILKERQED